MKGKYTIYYARPMTQHATKFYNSYTEFVPPSSIREYVGISTSTARPEPKYDVEEIEPDEEFHSQKSSVNNQHLFEELKSLPERLKHIKPSTGKKKASFFAGEELSTSQRRLSVQGERDDNALEFLEKLECVIISSYLDSFELGFERDMVNPWKVTDISGNIVYLIGESYGGPFRNCLEYNRPFRFNVHSLGGFAVLHFVRTCNVPMCCFGSRVLGNNVYITSSITHQKLGYIKQHCSGHSGVLIVWDAQGKALYDIEEPEDSRKRTLPWRSFQIKEIPSKQLIGTFVNRCARKSEADSYEMLSSSQYTLAFNAVIKPDKKAVLLGAAFCIIITYFEPGGPGGEYSDKWTLCTTNGICIIATENEKPSISAYWIREIIQCTEVAEMNTKGTDKDFIMHMFSPDGTLALKMLQRHKEMWKVETSGDMGDLKRYLERDQRLPSLTQRRTSEHAPEYEIIDDKPDAHVHVELSDGVILGTLWHSETAWVVHDRYLIPLYTLPEDPDPRHPTPNRHSSDVIYNFYSAGAEINTYTGSPLGKIETNVDLDECGAQVTNWVCIGIRFPDHFNVVDKALILGVALNQYCRIVPLTIQQEHKEVNPSSQKCFLIICTGVAVVIVVLGVLIVAGLAFTFYESQRTTEILRLFQFLTVLRRT
ncbi:unnamed protein product [Allacma fusca]|uniref:Uncharacterized protein n=1 Tax=Allacma fusca TaxID=39272 RepID=A0A8J2LFT4_9HEXA|nr:unnamed protein product [Allacma fusca]